MRLVSVLRLARIAVHARRPVANHGFDRVSQEEFTFATPTVNCRPRPQHAFSRAALLRQLFTAPILSDLTLPIELLLCEKNTETPLPSNGP